MASHGYGLHHLKSRIFIHAPAEVCYQSWLAFSQFPDVMKRVLSVYQKPKSNAVKVITSPEEIETRLQLFKQDILPSAEIRHWLLSGPGGKLYEVENTTVLEIQNRFYCTMSTDLNDLCSQSSLLFSPDAMNQNTLLEWQVSFWSVPKNGSVTQLALDIWETDDSFLQDCLQDFKVAVENKAILIPNPVYSYPDIPEVGHSNQTGKT